jgi:primase-polymerase (primpol)-like protein
MIGNPLKTNKIPLHPKTLHAHSPLDTTIHMDYVTAKQQAMLLGDTYGIGFVFMAEDKYFFIDIDNCLQPDNSWSQRLMR